MTNSNPSFYASFINPLKQILSSALAEPVFPIKAVCASACIIGTVFYLPLGVILFAVFIYLHLILRVHLNPLPDMHTGGMNATQEIMSPVDGVILDVREEAGKRSIILSPSLLDNHIIYMPISAELDQVIHFSGRFDKLSDNQDTYHIPDQNMRYSFSFTTKAETQIEMHVVAHPTCRFIATFSEEGRFMQVGQALAFGLFRPVICLELPENAKLKCRQGQRCLAGDSILAELF